MAMHGIDHVTIGVPDVAKVSDFYTRFGLDDRGSARFGTTDAGEQLQLVQRPHRQLIRAVIRAEDPDDIDRVRRDARVAGFDVEDGPAVEVTDPISGATFVVAERERIEQPERTPVTMNAPGHTPRDGERAPGIFAEGPVSPRRLGHVMMGTNDLDASLSFYVDVLGFKITDLVPGLIAFLRCSPDHHNIGLVQAPVPFLHHTSWQVDDVDVIGQGAHHLISNDPACSVWGLGRHFLGSNLFWYFRDPAGNYAEYFADIDQITDDDAWIAREWEPDKSLYAWGPPVPSDFVEPPDIGELVEAARA